MEYDDTPGETFAADATLIKPALVCKKYNGRDEWFRLGNLNPIYDPIGMRRRLTGQKLIDRFIRESLRCQTS